MRANKHYVRALWVLYGITGVILIIVLYREGGWHRALFGVTLVVGYPLLSWWSAPLPDPEPFCTPTMRELNEEKK